MPFFGSSKTRRGLSYDCQQSEKSTLNKKYVLPMFILLFDPTSRAKAQQGERPLGDLLQAIGPQRKGRRSFGQDHAPNDNKSKVGLLLGRRWKDQTALDLTVRKVQEVCL